MMAYRLELCVYGTTWVVVIPLLALLVSQIALAVKNLPPKDGIVTATRSDSGGIAGGSELGAFVSKTLSTGPMHRGSDLSGDTITVTEIGDRKQPRGDQEEIKDEKRA